jgi:hypothetical protein
MVQDHTNGKPQNVGYSEALVPNQVTPCNFYIVLYHDIGKLLVIYSERKLLPD